MELFLSNGKAASDGEDIYWELTTTGNGDTRPVVVLSHGAGGTHAVWYQQVPALAQSFRVLTWDSRGFGNSTNRNDAPSADAAGADLAAVLDSLDITTAHFIGQSMGGWHTSAFIKHHPDRVLSVVYADTVGGMWTPELKAAFAEYSATASLQTGDEPVGAHPAVWRGTSDRDPARAFLYQQLGSFHSPPTDKLMTTINWTIPHATVAALGVPVLFVAGEHDQLFPPALLANSCALLPTGRYVEIAEAGHSPYFEQPKRWNEAVLGFLMSI